MAEPVITPELVKQHKLTPLPQVSALDPGPGANPRENREIDALALHCVATNGQDCDRDAAAAEEDD